MNATLAPTRRAVEVLACDIQPGDLIAGEGCIPILVTTTRHPIPNLTIVDYECCVGCDSRFFSSNARLVVQRLDEGSH